MGGGACCPQHARRGGGVRGSDSATGRCCKGATNLTAGRTLINSTAQLSAREDSTSPGPLYPTVLQMASGFTYPSTGEDVAETAETPPAAVGAAEPWRAGTGSSMSTSTMFFDGWTVVGGFTGSASGAFRLGNDNVVCMAVINGYGKREPVLQLPAFSCTPRTFAAADDIRKRT